MHATTRSEVESKRAPMTARTLLASAAALLAVGLVGAGAAQADNGNRNGEGNGNLQADPEEFVGRAGDCGAGAPAGSRIVTARWLNGLGLPDDTSSSSGPGNGRNDKRMGLLLSKNGLTTDCSSADATIKGVKNLRITDGFTLGFDIRNGTHCGAGAPRFNVMTRSGAFSFVGGCANGTQTPAPQDPAEWTRVRFTVTAAGQAFPPLAVGDVIESITIIYDEGTDTPTTQDPMGVGLAVIDNIDINGRTITRGGGSGNDD